MQSGGEKLSILAAYLLVLSSCVHGEACENFRFGPRCQFECRCQNEPDCLSFGIHKYCPNGCQKGYIGPQCQYKSFSLVAPESHGTELSWLTDDDRDTCNKNKTQTLVKLWMQIPTRLTYIALMFNAKVDAEQISIFTHFFVYDLRGDTRTCPPAKVSRPLKTTMTVYFPCWTHFDVKAVSVQGPYVKDLCDIQVSPGRNIALNPFGPTHTDPGNDGDKETCAERGKGTSWVLKLPQDAQVNLVLLHLKDKTGEHLHGYTMKLITSFGSVVYEHKDNTKTTKRLFPEIPHSDAPVVMRMIELFGKSPLEVCEVEIFGEMECPNSKYGVTCDKPCNCFDKEEKCHMGTGACIAACAPGKSCNIAECSYYCQGSSHACDKKTMKCLTGCMKDYGLATCDKYCPGKDCSPFCSVNCPDGCQTGAVCTGQCKPGYRLPTCKQECFKGTYGRNCRSRCGKCNLGVCDKASGVCHGGCKEGYRQINCKKGCKAGTYGRNCAHKCGPCKGEEDCDKVKGRCPHGCKLGYASSDCKKQCPASTYGEDCSLKCSDRCYQYLCDPFTGKCNSCPPGAQGPKCDKACPEMKFGQNCTKTCACKDGVCNSATGLCSRCPAGKVGPSCREDCPVGRFGKACNHFCTDHCKDGASNCDSVTGKCKQGCINSYQPPDCEECMKHFYGGNCSQSCSNCGAQGCKDTTGECVGGCGPGWWGVRCDLACPFGRYGYACNMTCSSGCKDNICDKVTGKCGACDGVLVGDFCIECPKSNYGENCNMTCSEGCKHDVCERITGKCRACKRGKDGDFCTQAADVVSQFQKKHDFLIHFLFYIMVALVVGALLFLMTKPQHRMVQYYYDDYGAWMSNWDWQYNNAEGDSDEEDSAETARMNVPKPLTATFRQAAMRKPVVKKASPRRGSCVDDGVDASDDDDDDEEEEDEDIDDETEDAPKEERLRAGSWVDAGDDSDDNGGDDDDNENESEID